jgi:hypothetical protein
MKNILTIALVSVMLYSCGNNEREESMEKTEECLEDKYDDGDVASKYKTIDEALTAYDFVSARTLLACYEDACYRNNMRQSSCPELYLETKTEWANKKSQENEHFKMMYKIVQTEVTYFLNNGEYAKARASANESDLFFIFKKQLPSAVNKWVDQSKLDLALKVLSTYTFTTTFKKEDTNTEFISEVSAYNDMLYSVLNTALFDSNKSAIKKVLLLVKPIAIGDKNGPKYSAGSLKHSILVETPKKDMKKKIKEAGIIL